MTEEIVSEKSNPDEFISTGLKKFDDVITPEKLTSLVNSVKDLVIKDVNDKAGVKAVSEARKTLKKNRVLINKKADEIREVAKRFNLAVIAREKELTGLITPTEDVLQKREDDYYEEVERIRQEEERKESERIQNMIDKLAAVNYAVDFHELKAITEEQFEVLLSNATEIHFKKVEEERVMKEELEREKQREEERKAKEREELERQRQEQEEKDRELKAREAELNRQEEERQAKIKAEEEERQRKIREEEEERRKRIEAEEKELADRKAKLEAEERERKEKIEAEARAKKEAEERARFEEEERIEKERLAKEEEEERLKFGEDSDRFAFHAGRLERDFIHMTVSNHMKSKKAKEISAKVDLLIRQAYDLCKENARDFPASPIPEGMTLD